MAFGKEIKRMNEKQNWSASKLAKALGVDAARLRKWMERDSDPRDDEDIRAIENAFGFPMKDIIRMQEFPKKFNAVTPNDLGTEILANQVEILAHQRVILNLLSTITKPDSLLTSNKLHGTLQALIELEKEKVSKGKQRKS